MSINHCANGCGRPLQRRIEGAGRKPLYCSVDCRRQAEYAERRKTRTFDTIKAEFELLGEYAVRQQLAEDPEFTDTIIDLVETYLKPPDGRVEVDIPPEVLELLFVKPRKFSVVGHDNPLRSSADIDYAEETGDWSAMLSEALNSMTWQFAHGFKPDLSEFANA